jgi:hypothetical protein
LPTIVYLTPCLLPGGWRWAYAVLLVITYLIDTGAAHDGGCGLCDAYSEIYWMYLGVAAIAGLATRCWMELRFSDGASAGCVWLKAAGCSLLIAALAPFS